MMKKISAIVLLLIVLIGAAYSLATPEAREFISWILVATVAIICMVLIAAGITGVFWLWDKAQAKVIRPDENGDMPILIRRSGKITNLNLPPHGADTAQLQGWAIWRATCGKNGTPPANLFGPVREAPIEMPIEPDRFPVIGDGKLIDAVVKEL